MVIEIFYHRDEIRQALSLAAGTVAGYEVK